MSKIKQIVKAIKTAAKESGKPAALVSKMDVLSADSELKEWDLRKIGGLDGVKKKFFPQKHKDLATIHNVKKHNSYVSKLEAQLGNKLELERQLIAIVDKSWRPLPKIKNKMPSFKKGKLHREVVAMLNDTHVGLIIDGEEIGGLNNFDFKQAGRRFAYFVKEVASYKPYCRGEVQKLHLILNGDLSAGLIHGLTTKGIHLLVHQQNALLQILTHAVAYLLKSYNEIEIHGIGGNHSRLLHKNHGQRVVTEVYDNYENLVYYALSTAFRNNKNVRFNIPKTPYGFIDLPAGRAMFFHGDHVFSKCMGGVGNSINVKAFSNAIKSFNAGEMNKGNKPIKLLIGAHVHVYCHFITDDGVEVYIAPSLCGTDAFAHSLTINNNFAAQAVFESTPEFILGDSRLIRVTKADTMVELDEIIPTYNKELSWKK